MKRLQQLTCFSFPNHVVEGGVPRASVYKYSKKCNFGAPESIIHGVDPLPGPFVALGYNAMDNNALATAVLSWPR